LLPQSADERRGEDDVADEPQSNEQDAARDGASHHARALTPVPPRPRASPGCRP
jgi:hypothetical protein